MRTTSAGLGLSAVLAVWPAAAAAVAFQVAETEVEIYGYVMGKAVFDIGEDLGSALGALPSNVALDGSPRDEREGHWDATANQSRIGIATTTGAIEATVEGDFAPGSFRLRQAYFRANDVLIGQTWSNFSSAIAGMPSVDFEGLVGSAGYVARLPQIRYMAGRLSLSAEDPGADFLLTDAQLLAEEAADEDPEAFRTENSWPRVTARYEADLAPLALTVAAAVQGLEYRAAGDATDSAAGYGALLAAGYEVGNITVRGNINYTEGLNSYVTGLYTNDALVTEQGDIETLQSVSGSLSTTIPVGPGSLSVGYGRIQVDYPAGFPTQNAVLDNALVNYFWSPVESITYGVEYGWYAREQVSGAQGKAHRLAFSGAYAF